ncbi:MAG: hypothetical protein ACK4U0_15710 [Mesorhizobium sp.]
MDLAWEDRSVRRIIALLVALAALAERAGARRSLPVRWLVLVLLRYAEAVVLGFVAEETGLDLSGFDDDPAAGFGPMDAAILAWRLRTLAAVLGAWLTETRRCETWTPGTDAAPRGAAPVAPVLLVMRFGQPRGYYDTS